MEYKTSGWKLEPDGTGLTFTDGHGIGTLRLMGANPKRKKTRSIATFPLAHLKRVRLLRRADGDSVQFAVKTERQMAHEPTGRQVGIDVGLKSFYTDSQGQQVENPRSSQQGSSKTQAPASARQPKAKALQEPQEGDQTPRKSVSESE